MKKNLPVPAQKTLDFDSVEPQTTDSSVVPPSFSWLGDVKNNHISGKETLSRDEKSIARTLFKLKIHKSDGQAFEDLFTAIMNYSEPDFQQIKPWGNIGDRKNDGYIPSKGVFFQVYAPEDIRLHYNDAIKKLESDFNGLKQYWDSIKEFYFVVNDKYNGINADCEQAMTRIVSGNKLTKGGIITAKNLENKFLILLMIKSSQLLVTSQIRQHCLVLTILF